MSLTGVRFAGLTTVLFIAIGLSIFFAVVKLADSLRDIAFEIRETRRTMERTLASTQDFQKEYLQTLKEGPSQQATRASLKEFLGEAPDMESTDAPEALTG